MLNNKNTMTRGISAAIAANMMFGAAFPFTKFIFDAGISYYTMLSWRFLTAFVIMGLLGLTGILKINLRGKRVLRLIPVVLCEPCIYFIVESFGIDLTTASESAAIIALIPIGVIALSRLILKEKTGAPVTAAILLSVAGVIMIVAAGSFSLSFNIAGYLFLFAAVAAAAFYNIGVRKVSDEFTGTEIAFAATIGGSVLFSAAALIKHGFADGDLSQLLTVFHGSNVTLNIISMLFLTVMSSIMGFILINYAIASIGPARTSSFSGITTLVSVAGGMLFLRERPSPLQLCGMAVVIFAVWAANSGIADKLKRRDKICSLRKTK